MRWQDGELDAGTLTVRAQLQRIGKEWLLVEPKTERSRRTLDVPTICMAALRRHRARLAEERLAAGADWDDWGLVFTTRRSTPLGGSNVKDFCRRELERAGIRRERCHDLRHVCASFLFLHG